MVSSTDLISKINTHNYMATHPLHAPQLQLAAKDRDLDLPYTLTALLDSVPRSADLVCCLISS